MPINAEVGKLLFKRNIRGALLMPSLFQGLVVVLQKLSNLECSAKFQQSPLT